MQPFLSLLWLGSNEDDKGKNPENIVDAEDEICFKIFLILTEKTGKNGLPCLFYLANLNIYYILNTSNVRACSNDLNISQNITKHFV